MGWLTLIGDLLSRVPIERVLLPRPDNTKALQDFTASLESTHSQNQSQQLTAPSPEMTTTTEKAESPPKIESQEASRVHPAKPQPGGVSPEQTVDYQNREVGKLLLRMERHYAQRLRIAGVPCDCGSSKHLLDLESLCEETIPMVDSPQVYYRMMEWIKKVGPASTDEAAKSGLYDEQYPVFSHEARDLRKDVIGSLEPSALFPQKPGEPEGTQILPVVSDEEKEQIREKAHEKIEQLLREEGGESND